MRKIALANNYVTPYRMPLYELLAKAPDWDFKLFVSTEMEFDRQWKPGRDYPFAWQRNCGFSYKRSSHHLAPVPYTDVQQVHLPLGLMIDLLEFKPDVVISAEMGMRSLISSLYCRAARKPLILWFYQTCWSERALGWKRRALRKLLMRSARAFVGMGMEARSYLKSLGAEDACIFDAPNAAIPGLFAPLASEAERSAARERLGASGFTCLFVGRLTPGKGIELLFDAWSGFITETRAQGTLLVVGDGVMKGYLQSRGKALGLDSVRFIGFVQPEALPAVYGAADVLVFPTLIDNWGLVVNEALEMGAPVICSRYAGCAADLIHEGWNGWVIDPTDISGFRAALRSAFEAKGRGVPLDRQARESVAGFTVERMADGFRKAVSFVLEDSGGECGRKGG